MKLDDKARTHNLGKYAKRGAIPWNLGRPHTESARKKMSDRAKMRTLTTRHRDAIGQSVRGANNGMHGKTHTLQSRIKIANAAKGRKQSQSQIDHRVSFILGAKHHNWKGGITPHHLKLRMSARYKRWRTSVFQRDGYRCVWCSAHSGMGKTVILNADHIAPFATHPHLRFSVDNGRTLCVQCHRKTDTYGSKATKH